MLDFFQAHGIEHLVIPTRDYLFAPSFADISRAVQFIHRGFFPFNLILESGVGVNPSFNVFFFLVLKCSFFVSYLSILVQITQLAVKQLMFTVKLGEGGVQQLCFVIW